MSNDNILGLGLVGCGGFGEFCLDAYRSLPDVRPAAVADVVEAAAERLGEKFDVPAFFDPLKMIGCDDVDIVHIATPPSSHGDLVLAAARAGKHVLCEKPLAMNVAQADEMLSAAAKADAIVPVNFVLRYNAVTDIVKAVIDSDVMGKVLSARFTNCASDDKLGKEHWFWDKKVSGGIFVEHAVHFFDLYRHWLGPGTVVAAHTETRENSHQEDRVMCLVQHDNGAVSDQYHGFDQAGPMDRSDHRLVCELGDICVAGWIPLTVTIDALVDEAGQEKLRSICGENARLEMPESYPCDIFGRGKSRKVDRRIRITCTPQPDKQNVYADSTRQLLADQIAHIRDRRHTRRITEENGRAAVAMAEAAAKLAEAKT